MKLSSEDLANRLREAREACGLKQEEAARALSLSRSSIAQLELGNRAVSSLELDQLARLYGRDIRDFLAAQFDPEDSLVALFRSGPEGDPEGLLAVVRHCIALARELSNLEALMGLDRSHLGAPAYSLAPPRSKWQAIEQGSRVAADERRRLGLGARPVEDAAELLESLGIRTALVDLPDDVSGLTLMEPKLGLFLAVNRTHPIVRRRFSWIHEYAHVLLDRGMKSTLSRASNQEQLTEMRANAFAASFLLPEEGVRDFLADLGKGHSSRERLEIFDGESSVLAEGRSQPGAQALQLYDVVLLAHSFRVSPRMALYRLRNLHLLSEEALGRMLEAERTGKAKAIGRLLGLPERAAGRDEFRSRFLGLALEAYRREKISRGKLRELAGVVGFSEPELDQLLEDSGLLEEEAVPVSLPEDLSGTP